MTITCEVSLYPLVEDYEPLIFEVISTLKANASVEVNTHAMSTFIKGEHAEVFESLAEVYSLPAMATKASSLVIKIINRDLPVEAGIIF